MSLPTITNRANFDEEVLASKVPVVVCFYKKSSGSSEIVKSEVENNLMKRFEGQAKFVRVDVDETKDIAAEYKINAVPTQVMFRDRADVARVRGASTDALREMVLKNLA